MKYIKTFSHINKDNVSIVGGKNASLGEMFQNLSTKGILTDKKIADIESEVMEAIQTAIDRAEEQMKTLGDPMDMFKHTYAEMSPYLKMQKEMLAAELAEMENRNNG